jgi:hypothetical protein
MSDYACQNSSNVEIGNNSCKGKEACKNLSGKFICYYITFFFVSSSKSIYFLSSRYIGTVRSNSCISARACQGSDNAVIGTRSCLAEEACKDNTADISDYSCQGDEACTMNKAKIGALSCQAKSKACFHNEGSIGNGSVSKLAHFVHLLRHFSQSFSIVGFCAVYEYHQWNRV